MINHEELHQKIIDLENAKKKENQLRFDYELVLESLHDLTGSTAVGELISGIVSLLQKVFLADDILILKEVNDNSFTVVESTQKKYINTVWHSGSMFERIMSGTPSAVFDISQIDEWLQQPEELREGIYSALHMQLKGQSHQYIIICTHNKKGYYNQRHVKLSKRFIPFVSEILINIELQELIVERDRFFTLSLDLMCIIGFDGSIKQHNKRWEEILGYDSTYIMANSITSFIHSEDVNFTIAVVSRIMEQNTSDTFENRFLCSDGSYKNLLWRASSFSEGKMLYAVATDITRRKNAEMEVLKRNEIMERDLLTAQVIQNSLIDKKVPEVEMLNIDYRYNPLEAVGGDFFSFTRLDEGGLGLFIGDVCGHGVSAALFLSMVKFSTDTICREHAHNPRKFIEQLNTTLCQNMHMSFITAIYGFFSTNDHSEMVSFTFARGGHPFPVLYKSETGDIGLLKAKGTIIGMINDAVYESETILLKPGDRMYFYTDGVSEAHKSDGIMIQEEELLLIIKEACSVPLSVSLDEIMRRIEIFRQNHPFEDDVVLIGVEVR